MIDLDVLTSDHKYNVIQEDTGAISILRYEDKWLGPGFPGDGAVLTLAQDLHEARLELQKAVKYLKEGKAKFAPNTTNSFVDEFIAKHEIKES